MKKDKMEGLLNAVKPIPKDGVMTFWGKPKGEEWHHVAIVVENGKRKNYIDGRLVEDDQLSLTPACHASASIVKKNKEE